MKKFTCLTGIIMKCSLTGQNTRGAQFAFFFLIIVLFRSSKFNCSTVLAKAVNSFSRIGNDLYWEASQNGLTLRTVNDAQTAFAVMTFETTFFTDFKIDRSNSDEYSNKCKVSMKSCVGVLKNMRQVTLCVFWLIC